MLQSQMAEVRRREEEAAMLEQQQHALLQQQWDLEEAVRVCVRVCMCLCTCKPAQLYGQDIGLKGCGFDFWHGHFVLLLFL